ncbi:MAG: hypothetical protein WCA35_26000, partial [Kovacikia sp.]
PLAPLKKGGDRLEVLFLRGIQGDLYDLLLAIEPLNYPLRSPGYLLCHFAGNVARATKDDGAFKV